MKLSCPRALLQGALSTVSGVVNPRSPKEVLRNVKLSLADGKATLLATDEEVGMEPGQCADGAAFDEAADAAHAGDIAAVLHDSVETAGAFGQTKQGARFVHRGRHRLFREDVTAVAQTGLDDGEARIGSDNIEEKLRVGLGEDVRKVTADERVGEAELVTQPGRGGGVDVDETHDFDLPSDGW